MRLSTKLAKALALIMSLFCLANLALAEGISATRMRAQVSANHTLLASTRFNITLPEQLQEALLRGVSLYFDLEYRISEPWWAAYKQRIKDFIGDDDTLSYRLSYHPLTNRYRVSMGTFSTEYASLDTALRAIGSTVRWQIPSNASDATANLRADVRLSLSISRLPKPFQINALTSKAWSLDSNWQALELEP